MDKDDRELRDLLAALHAKLSHAKAVDPEARKLLATVADDIEDALELGSRKPAAAGTKLEEIAVKFEAEHPALAEAVRDVVDALGKAGI
jgi:hypothetical protein